MKIDLLSFWMFDWFHIITISNLVSVFLYWSKSFVSLIVGIPLLLALCSLCFSLQLINREGKILFEKWRLSCKQSFIWSILCPKVCKKYILHVTIPFVIFIALYGLNLSPHSTRLLLRFMLISDTLIMITEKCWVMSEVKCVILSRPVKMFTTTCAHRWKHAPM